MIYLTLGEAEKEVGVTKSTISRAIKDGRMSANRNENGHYQIDPAELFRVYPPTRERGQDDEQEQRNPSRNTTQQGVQHHATPPNTPEEPEMLHWLRERLERAEEKLAQTESSLEEKEQSLAELREAYNKLPSPESVQTRLEAERTKQENEKLKAIAQQKQEHVKQSEMWEASLSARKREIKKTKEEARAINKRCEAERIAREALSKQLSDLESRGFLARLLNRKVGTT